MKTIADIQVEPIGEGVSIRSHVREAVEILHEHGVRVQVHRLGTELEGDLDTIAQALPRIHRALHELGVERIATSIRMETRTDIRSPDSAAGIVPST